MKNWSALVCCILLTATLTGCLGGTENSSSLTMTVAGSGTTVPAEGEHRYRAGTVVEIAAHPADGWAFAYWEGEVADPYAAVTAAAVTNQHEVQAVFVPTGSVVEAPGGMIYRRQDGSPVQERPGGPEDIEFIMIHAMSDAAHNPTNPYRIQRIRQIFQQYGVESHYVVGRQGIVYQFVEDTLEARHAGQGSWRGDPRLTNNMNRYAVGIELLGIGTDAEMIPVIGSAANSAVRPEDRGYTAAQYSALRDLLALLKARYEVPEENILGHADYDPGRKWDPGELFDWNQL